MVCPQPGWRQSLEEGDGVRRVRYQLWRKAVDYSVDFVCCVNLHSLKQSITELHTQVLEVATKLEFALFCSS